MITSVQHKAAAREAWFAQSNFLLAMVLRYFVPRIVLYYCSNLMKKLNLSLKQSDIERKEQKGRFFPISLTSRLSRCCFLSLMRTDRSVIFRLQMLLLMMSAD